MPDERCLLDAGMPREQADSVIACIREGNRKEAGRLLKSWRGELLNRLHCCEKQIDCLDYFLRRNQEELE